MYRDPSGHLLVEAGVGLIVGGAWGLAPGYFSGDSGDQLWHDALVGAGVGALAGLTDGASLLEGASGYALRAGISAAGEAGRQEWNYGCVKSVGDVVIAGGLGAFGDMGSDAFSGAIGGASGELSNAGRAISSAGGGTLTGAAQTAIGNVEHGQEQIMNNEVNSAYDNFENSLPH